MTSISFDNAQSLNENRGWVGTLKRFSAYLAAEPEELVLHHSESRQKISRSESTGGGANFVSKRKTHAYGMLAIRWHVEIIIEKACIITACLVAVSYFSRSGGDGSDALVKMTESEVATVGAVLFCLEIITDGLSVLLLDKFYGVPMLTAVPHNNPFSKTCVA
jgi:hypothetical protein